MPDEETNRENFRNWLISQGKNENAIRNILAALGNTAQQLTHETVSKINTNLFFYSDAKSFNAARDLIIQDTEFTAADKKSRGNLRNGLDFYTAFLSGGTIPTKVKPAKKTSTKNNKTAEEATTDEECTLKTSKDDLISYMKEFYGFGNTKSKLYLIGQEEGGGEIDHRFNVWKENGCPEVIDIQVMHQEMKGADHYFNNDVSSVEPQNTYAPLIKNIVMPFFNYKEQTDYEFQACHFGRENGTYPMFVSDLYPLPCHGNNDWPIVYQNKLGMTKTEYRREYQNERTKHLKDLVAKNKPKVVIMYGGIGDDDFNPSWDEIAGEPKWKSETCSYTQQTGENTGKEIKIPFYISKNNNTVFIKISHPTARFVNADDNKYYRTVFDYLKKNYLDK